MPGCMPSSSEGELNPRRSESNIPDHGLHGFHGCMGGWSATGAVGKASPGSGDRGISQFLVDLVRGHEPGRASLPASRVNVGRRAAREEPRPTGPSSCRGLEVGPAIPPAVEGGCVAAAGGGGLWRPAQVPGDVGVRQRGLWLAGAQRVVGLLESGPGGVGDGHRLAQFAAATHAHAVPFAARDDVQLSAGRARDLHPQSSVPTSSRSSGVSPFVGVVEAGA